jgi:hypothetical protein
MIGRIARPQRAVRAYTSKLYALPSSDLDCSHLLACNWGIRLTSLLVSDQFPKIILGGRCGFYLPTIG